MSDQTGESPGKNEGLATVVGRWVEDNDLMKDILEIY